MNTSSEVIRLHTKENGTLDYDASVPCIIFSPIGFLTDEEFKAFLNLGLQIMIERKKYMERCHGLQIHPDWGHS